MMEDLHRPLVLVDVELEEVAFRGVGHGDVTRFVDPVHNSRTVIPWPWREASSVR